MKDNIIQFKEKLELSKKMSEEVSNIALESVYTSIRDRLVLDYIRVALSNNIRDYTSKDMDDLVEKVFTLVDRIMVKMYNSKVDISKYKDNTSINNLLNSNLN